MRDLVKLTLADQIFTILKNDIINQTLKGGEKLTLKALQKRFSISSTPIRDAMSRLNQEGLVDHVTNVGAKVVDLTIDDVREIYDFCMILDAAAFKLALSSARVAEFSAMLSESIRLQEKALKSNNLTDFLNHSDNFHDIFFRFADNSRLYGASLKIRSQLSILSVKYQNSTIAESVVFAEHKEIAAAVAAKEYEKAEALLKTHFDHSKSYMMNYIQTLEQ